MDVFVGAEGEGGAFCAAGAAGLYSERLFGGLVAIGVDVLVEADAFADLIGGGFGGDEDACAAAAVERSGLGEGGDGAADRVAVDAETLGERGLGREFVAGFVDTGCEVGDQGFGDPLPERWFGHVKKASSFCG